MVSAIKILIYASFLMPLIVMGSSFIFPFVFPKAIYFRILVELMVGLYLILVLVDKKYSPRRDLLFYVLSAFFFVLFLSAIFGADFSRSFFGNYERMSGWFTLIHFGAYFVVLANVFKSRAEWKLLFRFALLVSLFVGFTGLNFFLSDRSIMKIGGGGSLGNKIYLANFVLFHIFVAWYLFRKEEKRYWKIFAAAVGIIEIIIMLYNGKRGPFVGLVVGAFAALLLYSVFTRVKKWRLLGLGFIGAIVIVGTLIFAFRQTDFVGKLPAVGSLARVSLSSGTAETRLIAWGVAWNAFKEKPVFGWGVENFYYAFNKYYNPRSLEHGYYETWFDRSHNIFLDFLSTTGFLGFLSYLSIFAAVGYLGFVGYKKGRIDLDALVFLTVFFIAYATQNFFVFDHLSSYLIFFVFLAFMSFSVYEERDSEAAEKARASEEKMREDKSARHRRMEQKKPTTAILLIGAAVLIVIYRFNILPAKANNADFKTQGALIQNFPIGFKMMKEALLINGDHNVDVRNDFARAIVSLAQNQQVVGTQDYKEAVDFVMDGLNKNIQEHPFELQSWMMLGQYYALLGDFKRSEETYLKARELSPRRQQVAYLLVRVKAFQKDYQGAIKILDELIKDDNKIGDNYWYLGLIYNESGDAVRAFDNIKLAVKNNRVFNSNQELNFAAKVLQSGGDLQGARDLFELALSRNPNDAATLTALVKIYAAFGDKSKAQEMADRAALYNAQPLEKTTDEKTKK